MTDTLAEALQAAPRGRPTLYNDEIALAICERLAEGMTLNAVCEDPSLPAASTVRGWALNEEHPFSALYARARLIGYHTMADEVLDVADDGRNDWMRRIRPDGSVDMAFNAEHVQRSKLRIDTRKWLLAKALPKIYGDKTIVEGGDTPVQTVSRIEVVVVDPKAPEKEPGDGVHPQG